MGLVRIGQQLTNSPALKYLKLAIISAIILFAVIFFISLALPRHVRISRAIDISAPADSVRPLLTNLSNWQTWNAFIQSYHHRVVKDGMMKTDEVGIFLTGSADSAITADWIPPTGDRWSGGYQLIPNAERKLVTVQMYFDFQVGLAPWKKFQSIVYDQQMGPAMDKSLQNLQHIAEKSH